MYWHCMGAERIYVRSSTKKHFWAVLEKVIFNEYPRGG
jgi:hypothetical protein